MKVSEVFEVRAERHRDLVQRFALASQRHKIKVMDPDLFLLHLAQHRYLLERQSEEGHFLNGVPALARLHPIDLDGLVKLIPILEGRKTEAVV